MTIATPTTTTSSAMQRSARRTATINLVFNYAAIALIFVNGIVLVPIYLDHVPSSLYGAWLATGNILAWIAAIDPGVSSVMIQRVATAYGSGDRHGVASYATVGALFTLILAAMACLVGLIGARWISEAVNITDPVRAVELRNAFQIAVIGTALTILAYAPAAINLGLQSSTAAGLIFIAVNITAIVVTLLLLHRGFGVMAIAAAMVVRGAGMLLGNASYLLWRWLSEFRDIKLSLFKLKEFASLSASQYVAVFAGVISTQIDAILVARALGPEHAAMFILTKRAPDTCAMLIERPSTAVMPVISRMAGSHGAIGMKEQLGRLLRAIMWGAGLIGWGLIVFDQQFVSLWVGQGKFIGETVAVWMGLGSAVAVCVRSMGNLCYSIGEIRAVNKIRMAEAAAYLLVAVSLLAAFGPSGLAAAPVLVAVGVSGWYIGGLLLVKTGATFADLKSLANEGLRVLLVATVSGWLWRNVELANWWQFAEIVAASISGYVALAIAISPWLRGEAGGAMRDFATKWLRTK